MADQTVKSQQAEVRCVLVAIEPIIDPKDGPFYWRFHLMALTLQVHKLNHIINEADSERVRQKKEYDTVINERVGGGGRTKE